MLIEVEGRQDENPDVTASRIGPDLAGGLDAVENRHPDVGQEYVRPLTLRERDSLLAVGGLPDHLDVLDQTELDAQPVSQQRLVVADADSDAHVASRGSSGSTASTNQPSAVSPMSAIPPTLRTRVWIPAIPLPPLSWNEVSVVVPPVVSTRSRRQSRSCCRSLATLRRLAATIPPGECLNALVSAS